MSYTFLVFVVLAVAIVNVAVFTYIFVRNRHRALSGRDKIVGLLLAGPFFLLIDRELRKRNHKLTNFEYYGLLILAFVILIIIIAAIASNYTRYPS